METEKQLLDRLEEKFQSFDKRMEGTGLSFDTKIIVLHLKNEIPYRHVLSLLMEKATGLDLLASRPEWDDRETLRDGALLLYEAIDIVLTMRRRVRFDKTT